jgi:hypothetical protein
VTLTLAHATLPVSLPFLSAVDVRSVAIVVSGHPPLAGWAGWAGSHHLGTVVQGAPLPWTAVVSPIRGRRRCGHCNAFLVGEAPVPTLGWDGLCARCTTRWEGVCRRRFGRLPRATEVLCLAGDGHLVPTTQKVRRCHDGTQRYRCVGCERSAARARMRAVRAKRRAG